MHHSPPPPRLGPAHTHLSVASFLSFTRRSGAIPLGCWRITHCRALWLGSAEAIGAGSLLEDCPTRPTRPARQGTRQSDSLSNGPIPRRGRTKATSTVARTHCSPRHETHARQRKHARPPPPPRSRSLPLATRLRRQCARAENRTESRVMGPVAALPISTKRRRWLAQSSCWPGRHW